MLLLAAAALLTWDLTGGAALERLPFDAALLAAGVLLLTLTRSRWLPPALRRVLADAVLLTPLLVLPLATTLATTLGAGRGG